MKTRIALAFALAALVALAVPTIAAANFAIHGNYVGDTDACAGCHRAHTSVSTINWTGTDNERRSALLVTSATKMEDFCLACHDASSQGADTNVEQGVYEGSLYGTQFGDLNGGGISEFQGVPITSSHVTNGSGWGAYGGGYFGQGQTGANGQIPGEDVGESEEIFMDCATCHDPHGSPNYRILKAYANGNYVGGYQASGDPLDPDPDGWVSSVETGWPINGFRLHTAYPNYQPDYTTARYAKGYDMRTVTTATPATAERFEQGMSGWCAGCHSTYLRAAEVFTKSDGSTYSASASIYDAGDGSGLALRHRHPINVPLSNYDGPDQASMIVTTQVLPLAHDLDEQGTQANESSDWIECLTCHRAHGVSSIMTGYASAAGAASVLDTDAVARNLFPASDSALLRRDNRGVCEVCHNK